MNIEGFFVLLALVTFVLLWAHHNRISLQAAQEARKEVEEQGLQFLDQNVVMTRMVPFFNASKKDLPYIGMKRTYRFEFSSIGDQRYKGWITLAGRSRLTMTLEPYKERKTLE